MSKILRRRIQIVAGDRSVRADVEDNQHRFGIIVHHDGSRVLAVEADTTHVRSPWAQCPGAAGNLPRLVGMALASHPQAAYRHTPSAEQCTHMFDLASLAIAHAARGTTRRLYDMEVHTDDSFRTELGSHGHVLSGQRRLLLRRDGELALEWPMEGDEITAGPCAGQNVRSMMRWVDVSLSDLDEIEAITIARRTLIVSISLLFDMDNLPAGVNEKMKARSGACYSYQPALIPTLTRAHGSSRDFSQRPDDLLADRK
ncbi:DUF2889 domain-containing protein [Denitratisoma oestradiolicum]|uniref:DUF2889 domain-containing protein n=1 Tax=Denitratisoma oestradiolicum TaxID=311182 RepID=A0A6S6XNA0_9PROT|nr:DUF2889 domain-containing protein [Denitratisoma oestradiolicum]TWO80849.1 hypothetical protein CBW56_06740 [Denitratisoma oestradiolicum]CAB1367401.1 conserved protein of unknown function [Denitratisoma oestradiolicum]